MVTWQFHNISTTITIIIKNYPGREEAQPKNTPKSQLEPKLSEMRMQSPNTTKNTTKTSSVSKYNASKLLDVPEIYLKGREKNKVPIYGIWAAAVCEITLAQGKKQGKLTVHQPQLTLIQKYRRK